MNLKRPPSCDWFVSVAALSVNQCLTADQLNLTRLHGFISSRITAQTVCARASLPWVVHAEPGQRINVTLYDFSLSDRGDIGRGTRFRPCDDFGTLSEGASSELISICGGHRRVSHVHTSAGHVLTIRINNENEAEARWPFMLEYDSKLLGNDSAMTKV